MLFSLNQTQKKLFYLVDEVTIFDSSVRSTHLKDMLWINYEDCSIESGKLIGTNGMMVETFNQIILKEKEVFANFSKMVLRFMWNILSFLPQNGENFELQGAVKNFLEVLWRQTKIPVKAEA